jgi:hypothetical protein
MTSQEEEALSIRYEEGKGAFVVPLSDGFFGVFASDKAGESLVIVGPAHIEELMIAISSRANMTSRKTPSKLAGPAPNFEDFFTRGCNDEPLPKQNK